MSLVSLKLEAGLRLSAAVRQHALAVDLPPDEGGGDAGPTPVELLTAALGACMAMHVIKYCRAAHLPHEGLGIDLDFQLVQNPARIGSITADLTLPAGFPGTRVEAVKRVLQQCTVRQSLNEGTAVDVEVCIQNSCT